MNLNQAMASVYSQVPKTVSTLSASSSGCACRGECSTHIGPCLAGLSCACERIIAASATPSETIIEALNSVSMFDIFAGGPGSGRHKMGISDLEKSSVMHLRHNGFKSNDAVSVAGTHGYSRTDATGNTHVVNLSKSGFTHSMSKPGSTNFKQMGTGKHKDLDGYMSNRKMSNPGTSSLGNMRPPSSGLRKSAGMKTPKPMGMGKSKPFNFTPKMKSPKIPGMKLPGISKPSKMAF
jgi:hypothetical protein